MLAGFCNARNVKIFGTFAGSGDCTTPSLDITDENLQTSMLGTFI